jgi:hypothetical protein
MMGQLKPKDPQNTLLYSEGQSPILVDKLTGNVMPTQVPPGYRTNVPQTNVNVPITMPGEQMTQALPNQLSSLTAGQLMIEEFRADPKNANVLKDSDINVVTNTKGELQLEVQPKAAPSAGQQKEMSDLLALKNSLETIDALYDPSYVGLIAGNPALARAKETTGIGVDTAEVQFRRIVNDISDRLLRARSGAQINEQEYARLLKIVPEPTLSPTAFEARLKSFKSDLENVISAKEDIVKKSGQRPIGPDVPPVVEEDLSAISTEELIKRLK